MRASFLLAVYVFAAGAAIAAFAGTHHGAETAAWALAAVQHHRGAAAAAPADPDPLRPRPDLRRGLTDSERHDIVATELKTAAQSQRLDPGLVMAVAWWESGWDQSKVSETGAMGVMQVDPATARELGPRLLGRHADPRELSDNAALGAAVLRADLKDSGGDLPVALASYYEGAGNVNPSSLDAGAQTYVTGVLALAKRFDAVLARAPGPAHRLTRAG